MEENVKGTEQPTLTFGQRLVGINFIPANDDKVGQAKSLCAQLADLVETHYQNKESYPLPTEQKSKDFLFKQVIHSLKPFIQLP